MSSGNIPMKHDDDQNAVNQSFGGCPRADRYAATRKWPDHAQREAVAAGEGQAHAAKRAFAKADEVVWWILAALVDGRNSDLAARLVDGPAAEQAPNRGVSAHAAAGAAATNSPPRAADEGKDGGGHNENDESGDKPAAAPPARPAAAPEAGDTEREDDQAGAATTATRPRPTPAPPQRKPLPPWRVLLHNDDVNEMGYVVQAITMLTPLGRQDAVRCMFEAHLTGVTQLLVTHKERAELYQEQFQSKSLTVTIEPTEGDGGGGDS